MRTWIDDDVIEKLASASNNSDERKLAAEVKRLREAIRAHAAKRGHELCWLNDVELWKSVGVTAGYPHNTLPRREEFLTQCQHYYESRLAGTPYQEPETQIPVTPR